MHKLSHVAQLPPHGVLPLHLKGVCALINNFHVSMQSNCDRLYQVVQLMLWLTPRLFTEVYRHQYWSICNKSNILKMSKEDCQ